MKGQRLPLKNGKSIEISDKGLFVSAGLSSTIEEEDATDDLEVMRHLSALIQQWVTENACTERMTVYRGIRGDIPVHILCSKKQGHVVGTEPWHEAIEQRSADQGGPIKHYWAASEGGPCMRDC